MFFFHKKPIEQELEFCVLQTSMVAFAREQKLHRLMTEQEITDFLTRSFSGYKLKPDASQKAAALLSVQAVLAEHTLIHDYAQFRLENPDSEIPPEFGERLCKVCETSVHDFMKSRMVKPQVTSVHDNVKQTNQEEAKWLELNLRQNGIASAHVGEKDALQLLLLANIPLDDAKLMLRTIPSTNGTFWTVDLRRLAYEHLAGSILKSNPLALGALLRDTNPVYVRVAQEQREIENKIPSSQGGSA